MDFCSQEVAKEAKTYLNKQWQGIVNWKSAGPEASRSCAEPLVSHYLSARVSERPMAWSYEGVEQVCQVRVNLMDGGSINGDNLRRRQSGKRITARQRKRVDKKISAFAPLPSQVFQTSLRSSSLYRLYDGIKYGGCHVS